MPTFLQIDNSRVSHQNIDGEVIILNLNNGFYFSLASTAAVIWDWCDGATQDEILQNAGNYFSGDATHIEREIIAFIEQLKQENLLVARDVPVADIQSRDESEAIYQTGKPNEEVPFETPKVDKYEDLADLLLIDPIHDVDATGWPVPLP